MAVFTLGGALAEALPELAIGPWTHVATRALAFDADPGPPESLWRVELTSDPVASGAALGTGEHSVAQIHAALDDAPRRLDQAIDQMIGQMIGQTIGAANAPVTTAAPDLGSDAAPDPTPDLGGDAAHPGGLERVLQRVAELARGRARIETRVDSAVVACTVMTISGDTELWVAPSLSVVHAQLHARSVAVALRTRRAWTRIVALVLGCAAQLAVRGLPAGIAILPLVWRFLRDVLRELRAEPSGSSVRHA
jgi:hypothetical protein